MSLGAKTAERNLRPMESESNVAKNPDFEEELERSRRDLEDFFENGTVALHWVASDGSILRVNQAKLDLLGIRARNMSATTSRKCAILLWQGETSMKRAVLYLRVSTLDQTTANQERELREVAARTGCEIIKVYKDHGISGAKGRDKRPAFDALCRDATQRRFDLVMAWSVDRLGRSLQDLIGFLSELHSLGIDLFLHQQGLDTTTKCWACSQNSSAQ
jgi:PAS domain-containing protein